MTWRFFIQFCRTPRNSSLSINWRMLTHADVCWRMLQDSAQLVTLNQLTYADACWRMLTYVAGLRATRHSQSTQYITKQTGECLCVLPWASRCCALSSAPSFHSALRTVYKILEILLFNPSCTNISEHLKPSQLLLLQKFVVATLQQGTQAIWRFCSPLSACDRFQDLAQFLEISR